MFSDTKTSGEGSFAPHQTFSTVSRNGNVNAIFSNRILDGYDTSKSLLFRVCHEVVTHWKGSLQTGVLILQRNLVH